VQPYFDESDLNERTTNYERNTNINKFFYDLPYQLKDPEINGLNNNKSEHYELLRLCKKKTILQSKKFQIFLVGTVRVSTFSRTELFGITYRTFGNSIIL
jgi:hypothetical protein